MVFGLGHHHQQEGDSQLYIPASHASSLYRSAATVHLRYSASSARADESSSVVEDPACQDFSSCYLLYASCAWNHVERSPCAVADHGTSRLCCNRCPLQKLPIIASTKATRVNSLRAASCTRALQVRNNLSHIHSTSILWLKARDKRFDPEPESC